MPRNIGLAVVAMVSLVGGEIQGDVGWPPAPTPATGQTICHVEGDDGDLQLGARTGGARFVDNGDGTVSDLLTGLVWLKDANCNGGKDWETAVLWARSVFDGCDSCGGSGGDCGLSDGSTAGEWRLPNVNELNSLVSRAYWDPAVSNSSGHGKWSEGDPFFGVESSHYWTSSTSAEGPEQAWRINLGFGRVGNYRTANEDYVWPVKGGPIFADGLGPGNMQQWSPEN